MTAYADDLRHELVTLVAALEDLLAPPWGITHPAAVVVLQSALDGARRALDDDAPVTHYSAPIGACRRALAQAAHLAALYANPVAVGLAVTPKPTVRYLDVPAAMERSS